MGSTIVQIAVGGALGAVGRHLTGVAAARMFGTEFPAGTFSANAIGCLAMGAAFVLASEGPDEASRLSPLVMTGFLGGYTTMSAYSLDFWLMLNSGRLAPAFGYLLGSTAVAVGALYLGIILTRWASG